MTFFIASRVINTGCGQERPRASMVVVIELTPSEGLLDYLE
jgi:hypothetical protein